MYDAGASVMRMPSLAYSHTQHATGDAEAGLNLAALALCQAPAVNTHGFSISDHQWRLQVWSSSNLTVSTTGGQDVSSFNDMVALSCACACACLHRLD